LIVVFILASKQTIDLELPLLGLLHVVVSGRARALRHICVTLSREDKTVISNGVIPGMTGIVLSLRMRRRKVVLT